MAKCIAKKPDGTPCHAYALRDEKMCLFHSDSDRTKKLKGRKNLLSEEDMVVLLQNELRKVKREVKDALTRAGEIRRLVELIAELKGEKVPEKQPSDSIEKKIKKWKEKNQQ